MAKAAAGRVHASGSKTFRRDTIFNGVKVFSATMVNDRLRLGETVTEWIAAHPAFSITEIVVTQSSDSAFHCIALSVFYREDATQKRA